MKEIKSYISNLRFDPNLNNLFIAKYLTNPRLVILIIMMVILVGITSFASLPRVLNPEIKIPIVLVSATLPGAGPNDIESLVTVPIEDAVSGVSDVKTVISSSQNSLSIIQVEFNTGVDPEKARVDIQSAIDSVNTLPPEVNPPRVRKLDFQNQPVWTFIVTGTDDAGSLEQFSKLLQEKLENLPKIKDVSISGLPDREIQILLKPNIISAYRINPAQISQLISSSLGSYPAGNVKTDNYSFSLSIDQDVTSIDDLRDLRISLEGRTMKLSDIATISEKSKPGQTSSIYADRETEIIPAVKFSIFKTAGANTTDAVAEAEAAMDDTITEYDQRFKTSTIVNTSEEIDDQFSELARDFSIILVLLFITLFIFVGIRQAFVALLSTPLTFFITFTVMRITDISLSFIAIFSLLLSLGLLVDDTVVVISAITSYFRTKKFTPIQAGLLVWRDFLTVIFTTTITTTWAFLPLLLATGIIGEFIKSIPIVVSTTLMASFFVAMFIILPVLIIILEGYVPQRVKTFLKISSILALVSVLIFILPKGILFPFELFAAALFLLITSRIRKKMAQALITKFLDQKKSSIFAGTNTQNNTDHGIFDFDTIGSRYKKMMRKILISRNLRRRTIIMVILFSIFSYVLFPLGLVKNEFFPKSDNNYIYMSLELPSGTNIETSLKHATKLIKDLRKTEGLSFVTADVGQSFSQGGFGSSQSEENKVLFSLVLVPENKREDSLTIASNLRIKFSSYQEGNLQVIEVSGGPPAGADVQIKLFGDDLTLLDQQANTVMEYLKKERGTTNIDKSIKPGTSKIVFVPDKDKLTQAGLTPDTLGFWLRFFASGFKADSIKLENEISTDKKDIIIRMSTESEYVESISSITIPSQIGNLPLASLGEITVAPNPTLITREDGKRTISVTAAVSKGTSITDTNRNLEKFANDGLNLPAGYLWKTGGVNEENQNSVNSILQAMILSFFLIIFTLVIQFGSFRRAIVVMLVIPLSISGVFVVFALTQTPLSFPALIGVLALFGIVVKNSILVVDKIVQNQKSKIGYIESIIDASGSRLEPIALTSFATIAGLIPITLSNPLWRGLGGAIIAGLTFSGTIMLFFIPVVYYYLLKPKNIR